MPENDLMRAALALAMAAAPNGRIQQAFARDYEADRMTPDLTPGHVARRTIERVLDGLKFGNWPQP